MSLILFLLFLFFTFLDCFAFTFPKCLRNFAQKNIKCKCDSPQYIELEFVDSLSSNDYIKHPCGELYIASYFQRYNLSLYCNLIIINSLINVSTNKHFLILLYS